MTATIESTIDFEKLAKAIPIAVREDLLIAAKIVVRDCTKRIQRGVRLSGHAQRQNTPATQQDKDARLGHHRPLVDSGKLGRYNAWKINGVPPERARPPKTLKVRIDHPLVTETTFGRSRYAGKYYADIIPGLERRGYRVPIGLSRNALKLIRKSVPALWRAVLTQGRKLGPVSPKEIEKFIRSQLRVGTLRAA